MQKAKKADMYKLFVCAVMALTFQSVVAQDKGDIVIGMSLPLSGFNAAAGKEGLATATAYCQERAARPALHSVAQRQPEPALPLACFANRS